MNPEQPFDNEQTMERFIDAYVHGTQLGVLVELETADDFATRTDEFKALARDLAMQIAASDPTSIYGNELDNVVSMTDRMSLSSDTERNLMTQEFIKNPEITVADRIREVETQLGVPIKVIRFKAGQLS